MNSVAPHRIAFLAAHVAHGTPLSARPSWIPAELLLQHRQVAKAVAWMSLDEALGRGDDDSPRSVRFTLFNTGTETVITMTYRGASCDLTIDGNDEMKPL